MKTRSILKIILALLTVTTVGLAIAEVVFVVEQNSNSDSDNATAVSDEDFESTGEILEFIYDDGVIPPTTYTIRLNLELGKVQIAEFASCSAVDCEDREVKKIASLTNEEVEKLRTILDGTYDEGTLVEALDSIAHGYTKLGDSVLDDIISGN